MEVHDGDGLRTTVFFKGCPLKCVWCHNPESISSKPKVALFGEKCCGCITCEEVCPNSAVKNAEISPDLCRGCGVCAANCPTGALTLYGTEYGSDELVKDLLTDRLFFENSGGGVTLSGGECLYQPDFAVEVAKELKGEGISVYIDTCGFVNRKVLERIIPYTDKFLYDIKAIDPAVHKKCTGVDNAVILENLKFLCESGCKIEIRYPLVKGYNDGECEKIAEFLSSLDGIEKVKVLQYHSFAGSRYKALGMENTLPDTETTFADVENAVGILRKYKLFAVNGITED